MKKKLFLSILVLFIFSVCLVRVNASTDPLLNIDWNVKAKAPEIDGSGKVILPAEDSAYGTVTKGFDFSKVKFADASGNDLPGKISLEKIIIGELQKSKVTGSGSASQTLETLLKNYFTAYCLDENRTYPSFGLFTSSGLGGFSQFVGNGGVYTEGGADPQIAQAAVAMISVMNDSRFKNMLNDLANEFEDPAGVMVASTDGVYLESLTSGKTMEDYFNYILGSSNTEVKIGLKFIAFESPFSDQSDKTIYYVSRFSEEGSSTAAENAAKAEFQADHPDAIIKYINIDGPSTKEFIELNASIADLAFQKFSSTTLNSNTGYNHAQWIVENSYPTLTIAETLSAAGADIDTFKNQVKSLYSLNDSQVDDYTEMVVYGIVQYSIWKVTGSTVDGERLGNSIKNGTELDKLYKYLINANIDFDEYVKAKTFSNKITVTLQVEDSKRLYKKTEDFDYYGPYKATYNALVENGDKIRYELESSYGEDIKLVDGTFREITTIDKDQEFYIKVNNKTELSNVSIDFKLNNVVTFSPAGNRGRIYYPISAISQNALIGGKKSTTSINGTVDLELVGNPKTGIQNIALLLMVTLVAFTLGYLVLSYKQKPISLQ